MKFRRALISLISYIVVWQTVAIIILVSGSLLHYIFADKKNVHFAELLNGASSLFAIGLLAAFSCALMHFIAFFILRKLPGQSARGVTRLMVITGICLGLVLTLNYFLLLSRIVRWPTHLDEMLGMLLPAIMTIAAPIISGFAVGQLWDKRQSLQFR